MQLRRLVLIATALVLLCPVASAGTLVAGPMLGYRAHREVFLWVETRDAQWVTLDWWPAGQPAARRTLKRSQLAVTPAGGQISHFRAGLLEPGTAYEYELSVDGEKQDLPFPARFATQPLWEWRSPPPDFTFLVGSCAYINDPAYDRPGEPYGRTTRTFELMGESGADFMVWLGDNWYYREADFDSVSGLWYRAQHDRSIAPLRRLLGSMHHYAIWDDHDYGPNDSNRSYEYKAEALRIFQAYWGNHSYGEPDNPGAYTKFYWGDAAFFLMDNHYHRDASPLQDGATLGRKTQYGPRQLDWLKQSLLQAQTLRHFTFKFIFTGGQVLTEFGGFSESFAYYPAERAEILDFIRDHGITGVVFLSGDVHATALSRQQLKDGQWLYELTSSPLSSGVSRVLSTQQATDPKRVDGTLVEDQNFCTVAATGPAGDRRLVILCTDKQGAVRWTHTVRAADLGHVAGSR